MVVSILIGNLLPTTPARDCRYAGYVVFCCLLATTPTRRDHATLPMGRVMIGEMIAHELRKASINRASIGNLGQLGILDHLANFTMCIIGHDAINGAAT